MGHGNTGSILALNERRESDNGSSGSVTWKGIRPAFIFGLAMALGGGGTAYVKRDRDDSKVALLELRVGALEKATTDMAVDIKFLVQAELLRQGKEKAREEAGRRR